jgi:hypothetical protein
MSEQYHLSDRDGFVDREVRRRELRIAEDVQVRYDRARDDLESYWFAGYTDRDGTYRTFEPKRDYEAALDHLQDQFVADVRTSGGSPIFDQVYTEITATADTAQVPLEIETGGRLYFLREHRRRVAPGLRPRRTSTNMPPACIMPMFLDY